MLKKGPFLLSPEFNHLELHLLKWSEMTQSQKQKHLAKVDGSFKKGGEFTVHQDWEATGIVTGIDTGIDTANNCDVIGNFDDFNLPEFLRGTWKNANRITELDRIGPFPNDTNKRTVLSLSTPTVHTVEIKSKGKQFVCDKHCQ